MMLIISGVLVWNCVYYDWLDTKCSCQIDFGWWNKLLESSIYAGYKQSCLSTGNDLEIFWVSLVE